MDFSSYLTIPVVPGGRTREEGVDCWGLVVTIYRDLGIDLDPRRDVAYDRGPEICDIVYKEVELAWREVDPRDRREGDVVVLRVMGVPWHVGVLVDKNRFIHADPVRGICLERLEAVHWRSRVVGYRRLKDDAVADASSPPASRQD